MVIEMSKLFLVCKGLFYTYSVEGLELLQTATVDHQVVVQSAMESCGHTMGLIAEQAVTSYHL